jgi:hypothetical protein
MDMRRHLESQLRQIRQELPRHPWLAARAASLLLATGRRKEALALLRKALPQDGPYPTGKALLANLLAEEGRVVEAEALREEICRDIPGGHTVWLERLRAARADAALHHRILLQAWSRDLFSVQLNQELERAGLLGGDDYEQALRPTAAEAALREEQFRRLLDLHSVRRQDGDAGTTGGPAEADPPPSVAAGGDGSATGTPEAEAPGVDDGPATAGDDGLDSAAEDESSDVGEVEAGSVALPATAPVREGREPLLREHAERLEGLSRPLSLDMPGGLSVEAARRVRERPRDLFDPRSMMTRRLARIYLEQGYPGLAIQVLEALAGRDPQAADLPSLLEAARAEERRLAEQPNPRRRR